MAALRGDISFRYLKQFILVVLIFIFNLKYCSLRINVNNGIYLYIIRFHPLRMQHLRHMLLHTHTYIYISVQCLKISQFMCRGLTTGRYARFNQPFLSYVPNTHKPNILRHYLSCRKTTLIHRLQYFKLNMKINTTRMNCFRYLKLMSAFLKDGI
jgi:hypothetical protein